MVCVEAITVEGLLKNLFNSDKPVFPVDCGVESLTCLFDTGADTPVFARGRETLLMYYPDAELINNMYFELHGFGVGVEQAEVFKIPKFAIKGDNGDYIQFNNLYIACCRRPEMKYPMILSATMFKHMDYGIFNRENKELWIKHDKAQYEVGCIRVKERMLKIYTYVQHEERLREINQPNPERRTKIMVNKNEIEVVT